jgi:GNAT superfamily N-acetyltransferase
LPKDAAETPTPLPRAVGFTTELALVQFDGVVQARPDYWVVRTPSSPHFYWGNLLLFRRAPRGEDDAREWLAAFERELGHTESEHCLLAWDSPGERGDTAPFLASGFELDEGVILTARQVHPPPHPNEALEVRPLSGDAEWAEAVILQSRAFSERSKDGAATDRFAQAQMARYRKMVEAGWGVWWGGFLDGRLAGTLGLFSAHGLSRFQLVGTHPEFRKRGVAGTLVYEVSRRALASGGIQRLVMAADATYHAARVYTSVGFEPTEKLYAVLKVPGRRETAPS